MKMHAGQVDVSVDTVAEVAAAQLPQWSGRPVRPVTSHGTVNALFRLGDDVVLRFPLCPSADDEARDELTHEQDCSRLLAPHVPLDVPEPLALGEPSDAYPGWWTAYRWIPGSTASLGTIGDPTRFAHDLAGFVTALGGVPTGGRTWDGGSRGGPLATRDDDVRESLALSEGLVDVGRLAAEWQRCLDAAPPTAPDRWIHADLMPGNLLVRDGELVAVIDLGAVCVGDLAVDLMPAWNLLPGNARDAYRAALGVDDDTWLRGRGWAIVQAIVALPYYVHTNPVMADTARRTLAAVLEDSHRGPR
jgi:aminoglycoside phosphotransferase (APT) family kinase protein